MTPRNLAPDLRAHGLTLCPACTDTVAGELTTVGCERCHHSGRAHLFWLTATEHDILIDHGPGGTASFAGRMTIADPDVRADVLRLLATVPGIVIRDRRRA